MAQLTDTSTPQNIEAFLNEGRELAVSNFGGLANALVDKAVDEAADAPRMRALAKLVTAHKVPQFHNNMLRDAKRNAAYRAAIERVAPGRTVLDIGTGSGLLAMLAAKAGAAHVFACEANSMLAATARDIIEANGLSDRITVLNSHSTELDPMRDCAGGVDLVLSEIFSDSLIGEGVLPSLAHARSELCADGAIFLPEAAEIRVALAQHPRMGERHNDVEGCDLSLFNRHFGSSRSVNPAAKELSLRSDVKALFAFDFNSTERTQTTDENTIELTADGGSVNGLIQWIQFTLTKGISYENHPGSGKDMHWPLRFIAIDPSTPRKDSKLRVGGWRDEHSLALWADD